MTFMSKCMMGLRMHMNVRYNKKIKDRESMMKITK